MRKNRFKEFANVVAIGEIKWIVQSCRRLHFYSMICCPLMYAQNILLWILLLLRSEVFILGELH